MLPYPHIDPVLVSFGPVAIRWYGIMYILGFIATYKLVQYQIKRFNYRQLGEHFENLNLVLILGVIIGGRLGYVLFYNFRYFVQHPLEIFATWQGGMSFHGGCLGVIIFGYLYARKYKINFWKGADIYVATVPIGLGLGRIGNFINDELYGRITKGWWGMIFPSGGPLPRHPSQLYEAALEGFLLFVILWIIKDKPWDRQKVNQWPHGSVLASFLILYGFFRFFIEFAREPDAHIGYVLQFFTLGQVLCTIMIAVGVLLFKLRRKESE